MVFAFHPPKERPVANPERVCSHLRTPRRDLGMLPPNPISITLRGCELRHRRLLVHCIDILRKPRRRHRTRIFGHLRWHQTAGCPALHSSAISRSPGRHDPVPVASSGSKQTSLAPLPQLPPNLHQNLHLPWTRHPSANQPALLKHAFVVSPPTIRTKLDHLPPPPPFEGCTPNAPSSGQTEGLQ
jgi:hypothetical protein